MNRPLYLRGLWRNDTLHFDPTGHLIDNSGVLTFTLSGFDLKSIRREHDKLVLEGRRMGLEFINGKQQRVSLGMGMLHNPADEPIHIEIAASPTGDYGPALDAIFTDGLVDLVPSLPFYWKSYAQDNFVPDFHALPPLAVATKTPDQIRQSSSPQEEKPNHMDDAIIPPKLLRPVEPKFNDVARRLQYGGTALVNLQVKSDGTVANLSVVRPLGLGLDENALIAVQQYVFTPAMRDGKPTQVELSVEVNFSIY
jgi:TonB family protein